MKMTINLRKVLFFLLTLCLIGSAYAQDTALKEAEVAYTKEDYAKAIELYEGILKSNGESAAVYCFLKPCRTSCGLKATC